jgi:hypothetical protein
MPLSVQVQYSRKCPIISSSCYNSSLFTWTVVYLTAAKFKPLIFTVSGFALSNVANICIFMILYDFCLLTGLEAEAEAYCREPAGTLKPGIGSRWDPWPYICSMSRPLFCFVFPFVDPPCWQRRGWSFIYIYNGVYLLHLTPPEVTFTPSISRVALNSLLTNPTKNCWSPLTERLHSNGRGADLQKTSHVIPGQRLHWCAGCYLATSNKHSFIETQLLLLLVLVCLLSR